MVRATSFVAIMASLFITLSSSKAVTIPVEPGTDVRDIHLAAFGSFEDGTYITIWNSDGTATVETLSVPGNDSALAPAQARAAELQFPRRGLDTRACPTGAGCDGILLNSAQCDAAVAGLQSQCGLGIRVATGNSVYTINGITVAFYCQWTDVPVCVASSDAAANGYVTTCCGLYGAGSFTAADSSYSYGYTVVQHGWCIR
ncbi:hypothetical protein BX600DRAFT_554710 [Xylariales sp. PMI_506]|nr:hypothetical protein BX600DRAFT_554710 [Xylariales sp. PMI_506]